MVEAVVLVVAFTLTAAYLLIGFGRSSLLLNVLMIVLWVIVAGVMLFVFWWRSLLREEMVRQFFVADDWVYNHEIGFAPMKRIVPDGDAYRFVTFAADALAKMSYGFEVAEAPEEFHPRFLISSKEFHFHFSGGEDDGDEFDDDDESLEEAPSSSSIDDRAVVVDHWRGALEIIQAGAYDKANYVEVGQFENARDLARLLEDNGAFGEAIVE